MALEMAKLYFEQNKILFQRVSAKLVRVLCMCEVCLCASYKTVAV